MDMLNLVETFPPTSWEAVGWSFLRRPVMSLCRTSTGWRRKLHPAAIRQTNRKSDRTRIYVEKYSEGVFPETSLKYLLNVDLELNPQSNARARYE